MMVLVKDNHDMELGGAFHKYLKSEGFVHNSTRLGGGYYDACNWIFIDLADMDYTYGRAGVSCGKVAHAITIDEFKILWEKIYKKYQGKKLMDMEV